MARSVPARVSALLGTSLVVSGIVLACGGGGTNSTFGQDGGTTAGNGTAGSGGDTSGSGGANGGSFNNGGNGGGGPNNADGACAATSSKGQQAPLDIYMMLDQSGSMQGAKWTAVTNAINAFVKQPLTGVSVGIQYFGLPPGGSGGCTNLATCTTDTQCGGSSNGTCIQGIGCVCTGGGGSDSCNAADYSKPEVEIAPLPGVQPKITTSIAAHSPSTSTPTSAALQGAVDHAGTWAAAHPGDVTIALFATDGDPSECDTNLTNIDAIAAKAAAATPKVLTFVIGVGSSLTSLNGIAAAGGTGTAFIVDTNANAQQQFLDALNKIRGTALGCNYTIPVPASGTPDYTKVNVQYTPGSGGPPQTIPKVTDASQCPATGEAWYYDNNSAPTQIILCAATCTAILADTNGEVDVLLGCSSILR